MQEKRIHRGEITINLLKEVATTQMVSTFGKQGFCGSWTRKTAAECIISLIDGDHRIHRQLLMISIIHFTGSWVVSAVQANIESDQHGQLLAHFYYYATSALLQMSIFCCCSNTHSTMRHCREKKDISEIKHKELQTYFHFFYIYMHYIYIQNFFFLLQGFTINKNKSIFA